MEMEAGRRGHNSFLGTGWSFPPEFSALTGEALMSSDEADIEASLRILLGTTAGERFLAPKYGLNMQDILFDPMNTTARTLLEERITTTMLVYEARIKVVSIGINTERLAEGVLAILIEYEIRATNSRFNLVYPFYLNDGSEVRGFL